MRLNHSFAFRCFPFLLAFVLAVALSGGCGSGASGGAGGWPGGGNKGAKLVITLPFPQKSDRGVLKIEGSLRGDSTRCLLREIPAGTVYFAIYISERGTTENAVPPLRVDRPASGAAATAVIENVPLGWKTIRILAGSASDEALAEAAFDIDVIAGNNPEITMALTPTMSPLPSPSPMPAPTLSPSPSTGAASHA
ncbi:MAG: hypothetical protein RDV48_24335 [Candidatus Eremiobacteraeota bacterium]|nr:hypothetical protein [Candidatus Eremiobacteraeota bacterium]